MMIICAICFLRKFLNSPTNLGLESSDNHRELLVTDVFKVSEHTSLEEHLGQTNTEVLLGEDTLVDELGHDRLSAFLLVVIALSFFGGEDGITLNLNICWEGYTEIC